MSPRIGSRCTVCRSKHKHEIDIALANGISHRAIGLRFGLSHYAVGRHADRHLSPQMKAALLIARAPTAVDLEELRRTEGEGLLASLRTQRARLETVQDMAMKYADVRAAVSVEGAITNNLALVAKLVGAIVNLSETRHTSILITADYLKLRSAIVRALKPYPEAAMAVSQALHVLESEAAADMLEHQEVVLQ
jgi:hypothetical protein